MLERDEDSDLVLVQFDGSCSPISRSHFAGDPRPELSDVGIGSRVKLERERVAEEFAALAIWSLTR